MGLVLFSPSESVCVCVYVRQCGDNVVPEISTVAGIITQVILRTGIKLSVYEQILPLPKRHKRARHMETLMVFS